ncbi:MogA/MoaB family molybdenum cofactor biosynthesis protein [Microbacterium bovistercoris]|uniref:MogA/MoaB family molybdenum cofactor biosynthesis protein n=1 Tax=Microbacterium bovistercoris TaxID=2293570 RepID=A0A371NYD2_9MICO|nr:MogA/MoaB family molybdenum cofactor biosynthesis protein [Microbacterium bovistercoris]REJ08705.1 MogA/MoaB family molybdenum cofactor biosynthesis protein [Microbacterium bovistercoris]
MLQAAVITVSDRSAAGLRPDGSGPVAVEALRAAGFACDDARIVPDGADPVEAALREAVAAGARLIVTSGGTGVAPRDATPEGTARVIERELPGIPEELRRVGAAQKPVALLTRGLAGVAGGALIVNLPGSPGGVRDGMPVLLSVAAHVIAQLDGSDH